MYGTHNVCVRVYVCGQQNKNNIDQESFLHDHIRERCTVAVKENPGDECEMNMTDIEYG